MNITRTSIYSGITRTLDLPVTQEQVTSWESGVLIQNAMPQLSVDQREFIMTGVTAKEWDNEWLDDAIGADEVAPMSDNELDDLAKEYDL